MAEAALLKAARSLDQSGPETVVSKLQRLWDALAATFASTSGAGRFHASEEVALRWLLKNMHSSGSGPVSPETETLRRWPLTWRILACIFARIPLFSLAKSLADRRFVVVLQQTAKDLATPSAAAAAASQSSLKRKRSQDAQFDLTSLREPQNCVVSAGALFEALRVLLARLDDGKADCTSSSSTFSPYDHMGAEHIKSFFSVPAADANILLEPLLKTCRLALITEGGLDAEGRDSDDNDSSKSTPLDGQASWISTFSSLWDLRLQGPEDTFNVAGRLSLDGLTMLGRLLDIVPSITQSTHIDTEVQRRWSVGLQRFFTNNLVLAARSLFLNLKDTNALSIATSNSAAKAEADDYVLRAATFFYLALKAPRLLAGSGTSSKDNELWLQTVFETIREPLMTVGGLSAERKNTALAELLDMAAQHEMAPSIDSLQQVCQKIALHNEKSKTTTADWRLLASAARCDADAFLLADKGAALLNTALEQLRAPSTAPQTPADAQFASAFLISLAQGFANSRNLAGFVTRWHAGIVALGGSLISGAPQPTQNAWLGKDLRAAVAETVQSSLSKEQLLAMIAQVEKLSGSDDKETVTAQAVAKQVIFDTLSAGVRSEEFEDAVQTKMLDSILGLDISSKLAPEILAIQWRLIHRTLAWVGFEDAERIWKKVKGSLKTLSTAGSGKKKSSFVLSEDKFEALIASFSLWMALKFGDKNEKEARETTWTFFSRFQEELSALVKESESQTDLLQEVARQTTADDETAKSFGGSFDNKTIAVATYLTWMLSGSSRFIDEMARSSDEPSAFLDALLAWQSGLNVEGGATLAANTLSTLVYSNVTNLQNQKITSNIAEAQVKRLEEAVGKQNSGLQDAALTLLQTPSHLLSRSQRERIVATLLPSRSSSSKKAETLTVEEAALVLDLLTKVTRERAFSDVDFDRLVYLGETVHATVESVAAESALGVYDRFQQVAKTVIKSPASKDACDIPTKSIPTSLQLVLYGAKLKALKNVESAQLSDTKEKLATLVVKQLLGQLESKDGDVEMSGTDDASIRVPVQLLLTFDAAMADDIQPQLVQQKKFNLLVKKAKKTADALCAERQKIGWKWKAFIAWYTRGQEDRPARDVLFQGLFLDGDNEAATVNMTASTAASVLLDGDLLRDYLAGETAGYDQEALLSYTEELLNALDTKDEEASSSSTVGQLLAIQYLLDLLFETPSAATTKTTNGFHFGVVHSKLAQRLPHARSTTECKLLAQTIRTLLVDDKAAGAMGQWNVDTTLSAAASVVSLKGSGSDVDNDAVRASPVAYDGACQLVEAVLKRHRVRLEGRFHLLVSTLQALLARLAGGHQQELKQKSSNSNSNNTGSIVSWVPQAKRFSRLLELICEPSTAAVTMMTSRKGAPAAPLHSATDAAKRSAGQHMYLVLMTYIKLQIDGAVLSRSVREALEPGLFSVLAITPDETRRLLNDAVDANGRALFKDLYRKWLQFGKWKGV
ncbi:hypothetical protein Sste5346_007146 [Sporothrix stenoceras]|uniref:Nucleolar 27S pre-rRNA processing Urb2/Npa2 C-terminal domain-containing protein n=1 Tax=Sporothrix stenoceras TaxID=5173 RepID=A0ABR3YVV4_9PEZI